MSCSPAMPGTPLSVINRGWGAWRTYVSAALLLFFLLLFLVPGSLFVLGESCDKGEGRTKDPDGCVQLEVQKFFWCHLRTCQMTRQLDWLVEGIKKY